MIIRYQKGILHVYTNSDNREDFKFCLAIKLNMDTNGMYISFSALTGQVADSHDITMLSTRYLDEKDAEIDDLLIMKTGYAGKSIRWKHVLFWLVIVFAHIFLIFQFSYEMYEFNELSYDRVLYFFFFFFF